MDQIRIGVIGVGNRGLLADYWNASNRAVVVAAADIDEKSMAAFRVRMGDGIFTTDDYRVMLARHDLDAVAVLSPDYCHTEHAVAALQAGKDVFLEKPLAISVEDCDQVLRTWKTSGKRLMMGFNMRYIKMFQKMKEIVDSGQIGEVRAVWVRHFVGMASDFYYHDWHALTRNTTSLLLQKGSHDIDMIHWITGKYTRRVAAFGSLDFFGGNKPNGLSCLECIDKDACNESVFGPRVQCVFRKEVDVEDNYVMMMELEGGIKATYNECHFSADGHRNYVFIGTHGQVENSELLNKVWVKRRKHAGVLQQESEEVYDTTVEGGEHTHGGADPRMCECFLDMLLDNKEPAASPIDGRMSVAAAVAGTQSLRSGGMPVDIERIDWVGEQQPISRSMHAHALLSNV